MKTLKPGESGTSHWDGAPFKVADRDSWMRSSNKRFLRKTASTLLRTGGSDIPRAELVRLATRTRRVQR